SEGGDGGCYNAALDLLYMRGNGIKCSFDAVVIKVFGSGPKDLRDSQYAP
ncbi:MAG: hypothetical protein HYX78_02575, partial [Armatimonadetes bacterium]|nr:hypothetical protein [Armatimonadota bacterium]